MDMDAVAQKILILWHCHGIKLARNWRYRADDMQMKKQYTRYRPRLGEGRKTPLSGA